MRHLSKITRAVLITLAVILVLFLVMPLIVVPIVVNRHIEYRGYATEKYPMQDIYAAKEFGLEEHPMFLTTKDGYNIWCSEVKAENPKAVIIYLSGIDQPSVTYFYGHSELMQEHNYATFLLETRGHGQSDGDRICFGYEEKEDVQAVVDYINQQEEYKNLPIVVHGVSMGGASAINAFGQIPDIDAVIAMSSYSSAEDVILDLEGQNYVPGFLRTIQRPVVEFALKCCFGADTVENIKPIKLIQNAEERPVLLIACTGDKNGVPVESTYRLEKACPNAQVWIRDSWEHFIVKGCDYRAVKEDTEYCEKILEFMESVAEK